MEYATNGGGGAIWPTGLATLNFCQLGIMLVACMLLLQHLVSMAAFGHRSLIDLLIFPIPFVVNKLLPLTEDQNR